MACSQVRAKFVVSKITKFESPTGSANIEFRPVMTKESVPDPDKPGNYIEKVACPENLIFGNYTPSGSIQMMIVNPEAVELFETGKAYYVDFTPTERIA